jgi:hypothetical protein
MRIFVLIICAFLTSACTTQQKQEAIDASTQAANDCFLREGPILAQTKTDLDTASTALLARCGSELAAERRAFINLNPGFRDRIEVRLRELDALRQSQARQTIAGFRAR